MGRRIAEDEESSISDTKTETELYYEPKYVKSNNPSSALERSKTTSLYILSTFAVITFIYLSVDLFQTIQFFTSESTPEELAAILHPTNYITTPSYIGETSQDYHPNDPAPLGDPNHVGEGVGGPDVPIRYMDEDDYPHMRKNVIEQDEPVEKEDVKLNGREVGETLI